MSERRRRSNRRTRVGFGALSLTLAFALVACGWDPRRPFDRESPEVREAIGHLDGGDAGTSAELLEAYLTTGACKDGNLGTPPRVRDKSNGSFDLGLALFRVAEGFGHPFGDEELDAGAPDPTQKSNRAEQVACAARVVTVIAEDRTAALPLRARAYYLQGNLHFLNGDYEDAVGSYDKALGLVPGMTDAGPLGMRDGGPTLGPVDPIGRDAAYNRAIALRRIDDKKDAGQDASSDASNDASSDGGGGDGGGDAGDNQGDSGSDAGGASGQDAGSDAGGDKDAGDDENKPKEEPKEPPDAGQEPPPPPSKQSQDERMLDQLENAPTVQQEAARKAAERRRVRGMNDK